MIRKIIERMKNGGGKEEVEDENTMHQEVEHIMHTTELKPLSEYNPLEYAEDTERVKTFDIEKVEIKTEYLRNFDDTVQKVYSFYYDDDYLALATMYDENTAIIGEIDDVMTDEYHYIQTAEVIVNYLEVDQLIYRNGTEVAEMIEKNYGRIDHYEEDAYASPNREHSLGVTVDFSKLRRDCLKF